MSIIAGKSLISSFMSHNMRISPYLCPCCSVLAKRFSNLTKFECTHRRAAITHTNGIFHNKCKRPHNATWNISNLYIENKYHHLTLQNKFWLLLNKGVVFKRMIKASKNNRSLPSAMGHKHQSQNDNYCFNAFLCTKSVSCSWWWMAYLVQSFVMVIALFLAKGSLYTCVGSVDNRWAACSNLVHPCSKVIGICFNVKKLYLSSKYRFAILQFIDLQFSELYWVVFWYDWTKFLNILFAWVVSVAV